MTRVGVVFGGRTVEHEVSVTSARTVVRGLAEAGFDVVPLGIDAAGAWLAPEVAQATLGGAGSRLPLVGEGILESLRHLLAARPEVLFPIVHGTWGEDGCLQGLCEMLDLPYVGAGVTASALSMDKRRTKELLATAGVPVVEAVAVTRTDFDADPRSFLAAASGLGLPLFVKPSVGGSSVGVRKVTRSEDLEAAVRFALGFDDAVLVERGVDGRELEVAVLGYPRLEASAVGEIVPGRDFYDYEDKYLSDGALLEAPAKIPPALAEHLRELAVRAFAAVGGAGMARVDFLVEEEEKAYVNEINTLPGFTSISMYPRLWALSGVPLPDLCRRLVEIAQERHRDRQRLDEGIKSWLSELGG